MSFGVMVSAQWFFGVVSPDRIDIQNKQYLYSVLFILNVRVQEN